jgi:hypothetical protein
MQMQHQQLVGVRSDVQLVQQLPLHCLTHSAAAWGIVCFPTCVCVQRASGTFGVAVGRVSLRAVGWAGDSGHCASRVFSLEATWCFTATYRQAGDAVWCVAGLGYCV